MDVIHRDNEPQNKIDLSIVSDGFERKYIKEFLDDIREYIIYEDDRIIVSE